MATIQWKEEFSVGNDLLDDHHRKLFDLLMDVFKVMINNKESHELDVVIEALKSYTIYHFQEEERLMVESEYPDYIKHKLAHDSFIRNIGDLSKRQMKYDDIKELFHYLSNWLVEHIMIEDKAYENRI